MGSKFKIIVDNGRCTGCLTCALECSFAKQNAFNPMTAYIRISCPMDRLNVIYFTDDCDSCGICARRCPYGALILDKDSAEGEGE